MTAGKKNKKTISLKNNETSLVDDNPTHKSNKKIAWLNFGTIATILIIKTLIFIFVAQSYQIVNDRPITEPNWFWALFSRWDAGNYLKIAQFGYTATGADKYTIVFFPLYPALIALFNIVFRNYVLSALVVSGIASLSLGLVFRELVKLDFSERTAKLAVLFLFIFPTSYFLHVPYTESLFLTLVIGSFLLTRKRKWFLVGILGALACLTRVNGLILFPALAYEVWEEYRETRRVNPSWLFLFLIPVGFFGYLALNYFVTGEWTMFMTIQRENFQRYFRVPWEGVWGAYGRISSSKPTDSQMMGVQEIIFVLIGLAGIVASWLYLRKSYFIWMALNWLLFISTSFVLSVPRYTLILFPVFILMALAARRDWHMKVLFTFWSILYLSIFLTQYIRGWWAF